MTAADWARMNRAIERATYLMAAGIGALLVVWGALALNYLAGDAVDDPGARWACAAEDEVVTINHECVHVDGLQIEGSGPLTAPDPPGLHP
jgi:hypothetical protein